MALPLRDGRPAWLVAALAIGAALVLTTYGAVLDVVSYADYRQRMGSDLAVDPDLAGDVTLAARTLVYVAVVAATALGARLLGEGRRRAALLAPPAAVAAPVLVTVLVTTVAWLVVGLPLAAGQWLGLVATTAVRTAALGFAAAALGALLARLGGGRSAVLFWVASAAVWLVAWSVVVIHELGQFGREDAAISWLALAPDNLAHAVVGQGWSPSSGDDGVGLPVGFVLLVALVAAGVLLAGLLARLGGRRRTAT